MGKKVDMRLVNKKLSLNKVFKSEMRKKVISTFESSKSKLINEFNSHPVTAKIKGGPSAGNLSGTLNGTGNLFTFIGFVFGSQPTEIVNRMLREKIKLGKIKSTNASRSRVKVNVDINMPTKEAFYAATPLPFESGRSWLYGIETGISGFGSYMYKRWKTSRSTKGIQTKKPIRGGSFKNTSYFSSMLLAFTKRIR